MNKLSSRYTEKIDSKSYSGFRIYCGPFFLVFAAIVVLLLQTGCETASGYRMDADKIAGIIINEKQQQMLGKTEDIKIERPSDILRRRLLLEQELPYSGKASLGTDKLEPVSHWPEENYPYSASSSGRFSDLKADQPLKLSLIQALQIGAENNADYQTKKEDIFRAALALDLKRDDFGIALQGQAQSSVTVDKSGSTSSGGRSSTPQDDTVKGLEHSGALNLSKTLANGTKIAAGIAIDLVSLLTQGRTSSFGILGDASISIPLLRGSGSHIVTEPLTQAERDVMYALYEFERHKQTFAVDIASSYFDVLKQIDKVNNAEENYNNLKASALGQEDSRTRAALRK